MNTDTAAPAASNAATIRHMIETLGGRIVKALPTFTREYAVHVEMTPDQMLGFMMAVRVRALRNEPVSVVVTHSDHENNRYHLSI